MACEFQSVGYSGITLQGAATLDAIVENACDQRAFVLARRLAFYEGCESDNLASGEPGRKIRGAGWVQRFPNRAEILDHAFGGLFAGSVMRELVRGRKEIAFEVLRLRREVGDQRSVFRGFEEVFAGTNTLAVEFGGDIEHRPAFGDGDGVDKNSALGELPENFARSYRVIEIIFTRIHGRAKMPEAKEREGHAVSDDIVLAKNSGDRPARFAVGDIHENFFGAVAAIGAADLRIEPAGACADCSDHQESQQAEPSHRGLFLLRRCRLQAATVAFEVFAQEDRGSYVVERRGFS